MHFTRNVSCVCIRRAQLDVDVDAWVQVDMALFVDVGHAFHKITAYVCASRYRCGCMCASGYRCGCMCASGAGIICGCEACVLQDYGAMCVCKWI